MKNKFLNDSIIYGLGFLFLRGISFLLLPIYTNLLTTHEAGIVFIIYTILAFLNPVFSFGMDSALLKFFNSKSFSKTEIISSSILGVICSSSILTGIIIVISMAISSLFNLQYNLILLIGLILFFDSISSRVLIVLRLLEKASYYLLIGLINIFSSLGCNVFFIYFMKLGEQGAIYSLLLTSFIQLIGLFPLLFKQVRFSSFNMLLLKKMFLFGVPFFPAALLFVITGMVDRFFINYFLTLEDVGIYGAGYKLGSIVSIVIVAFNLSWQPYYLKHHDDAGFIKKIKKISQTFSVCLLFIATCISVGSNFIIKIQLLNYNLIGSAFWSAGTIIPLIVFGYYFYGLFILQMPSIYIKNKQLWIPFFWGLAATTNVLLNILLIPRLGIIGAGIATLISYLIMFICIYIKNQQWMPLNFINKSLMFYFIISLLVVWTTHAFVFSNLVLCIIYIIYSLIGAYQLLVYQK